MILAGADYSSEAMNYYADHGADFVEDSIPGLILDDWQTDAFNKLSQKHFVAIRSGSGVGKTAWLGLACIWFLATKPYCKIPCTAPSQHQLYDLLWAETYRWISKSKYLDNLLNWKQTKIGVRGYEPIWYAVARTASVSPSGDIAEGLQGFHSEDNLLFLLDEASGVPDQVFPAVEGSLTGQNAYCILASNPTRREGYFFDVFHSIKIGSRYEKIHVSCYDSPRVTQQYIEMMLERYGEDHPIFQIKVLGDFPKADDTLLVPPAYLEKMQNNKKDTMISPSMAIEGGLDVGRTHSASVFTARQGYNILTIEEKQKRGVEEDTLEVAQWATTLFKQYDLDLLKIDAIYNPGVYDILKSVYGPKVVPVIGSAKSSDPQYLNLRAKGYWELRDIIPKLYYNKWPIRAIIELGSIKQKFSQSGKIAIESKEEMLRRAMRSPDYADSIMYAYLNAEDEGLPLSPPFANVYSEINNAFVKHEEDGVNFFESRWKGVN